MNVLAIDQGTSATKALLIGPAGDRALEVLGRGEVPVRTRSVGADGVEADPEELFGSVVAAGRRALAAAGAPAHALALANQGETVLAWDRGTGRPLSPAIVWQDRRSAGVCARLADRAAGLAAITGLPLDPYFAAPKMTWLRENLTLPVSGDGTVTTTTDTWLLARLDARYVTDAATASRTLLLDLDSAAWSPAACDAFGLDPAALPAVTDCAGVVGETSVFGGSLPVAGIAVDQQAALLAEGCLAVGDAKCTYGTGAFLLVTTGSAAVRPASGLSASVAWRLGGEVTYCLDGQVYTTTATGLRTLLAAGRRILPGLVEEEVTSAYAGLRAATEHSDYQVYADAGRRYACAGGIRSTGLSASLGIAEHVAGLLGEAGLALRPRPGSAGSAGSPPVMPYIGEAGVRPYQDPARIAADPAYGQIVCHCERVTRGEIRDALASAVPPADLGGLRRRTRAGNGRCQGFYCGAAVSRLLAGARGTARSGVPAETRKRAEAREP